MEAMCSRWLRRKDDRDHVLAAAIPLVSDATADQALSPDDLLNRAHERPNAERRASIGVDEVAGWPSVVGHAMDCES
jgi:hypothetical protein